LLNKTE